MSSENVRRWNSSHPGPTRELREVVEARHYDQALEKIAALEGENALLREGLTKAKIYALNPDETVNYNEVAKVIDETLTKSCAIGKG